MDNYDQGKEQLLKITRNISSLCDDVQELSGAVEVPADHWKQTCEEIGRQVAAEILRVAVVGPIKSGKSTFVNSLFKGDYLKRGAGVVTSIVTRIQKGNPLSATLFFKSWQEINQDIENAMVLFPSTEWRSDGTGFDIRNEQHRAEIVRAMASLSADSLITQDARNMNSVVISAYLNGYERVRDVVSETPVTRVFTDENFEKHQDFTGDDALAAYLRDIALTIDSGGVDENIEIADCQGSDSFNPMHLAMIQEYLRRTHLIVYVVSGRTGLRQADIKFLSAIKRMGIIDNTLFLVNFDFGEHESIDDLMRVARNIREDIALLRPDPDVYVLSALFNLFRSLEANLPVKDRLRLAQWKGETALAKYSDGETRRFEASIHQKLTEDKYALLLKNHLERLAVQAAGIAHWMRILKEMSGRDAAEVRRIVRDISDHQKKIARVKSMIRSTLDGAVHKIKQTLKADTDRFFDKHDGILGEAIGFLKGYRLSPAEWEHYVSTSGISSTMYLVYQDVKRTMDGFMADSVNPEIIRFIREEEEIIKGHFEIIAGSYDSMVQEALLEYDQVMETLGLSRMDDAPSPIRLPEILAVVRSADLEVPPVTASMRYSASIRGEAVMRLGVYKMVRFFRKFFRKSSEERPRDELLALKDGVSRLKRETEQSILFNFKDYRENIKFQYLLKLADAVSNQLYGFLTDRFDAHVSDLTGITSSAREKKTDTAVAGKRLEEVELKCHRIADDINRLKAELQPSP